MNLRLEIKGWTRTEATEMRSLRPVKCFSKMDIIINRVIWTELGIYVGLEVLTAVVVKGPVFLDIKPRSPLKVNRHLEEHVAFIFRAEK
jgi:hypothetical protein